MFGIFRHGAGPVLVAAPTWIFFVCAIVLATAVALSKPGFRAVFGFAAGVAIAVVIPLRIAPPPTAIVTRAPPFARGVDLFAALQRLDDDPQDIVGTRISVTGLWRPAGQNSRPAVYRVVMACCLADAVDVGFDVSPASRVNLPAGTHVRVSGIVEALDADGEVRYILTRALVTAVRS
jgi:hypothetical protein